MSFTEAPKSIHSTSGPIKWISNEDVFRVLTWDRLLPAIRSALVAYTQGPDHPHGAVQPLRTTIEVPQNQGVMIVMPGLVKKEGAMAVKTLTSIQNAQLGLCITSAIVQLMDSTTGCTTAILQGEALTELRTAAASAVATLEILRGRDVPKDGHDGTIVAVLGAGAQGRSHARVMTHILKPKKIMLWARRPEAAKALCATLQSEGIPAEVAATVQEAVKDADVINNCTSTSTPILKAEWVKPRAHVNSVGAHAPNKQEMEEDLVRAATIYADSYESAQREAGDIIKSGATVFAEIGEVILGTKPVLNDKITIFKSLGLAVEDVVSAQLVYQCLKTEEQ